MLRRIAEYLTQWKIMLNAALRAHQRGGGGGGQAGNAFSQPTSTDVARPWLKRCVLSSHSHVNPAVSAKVKGKIKELNEEHVPLARRLEILMAFSNHVLGDHTVI